MTDDLDGYSGNSSALWTQLSSQVPRSGVWFPLAISSAAILLHARRLTLLWRTRRRESTGPRVVADVLRALQLVSCCFLVLALSTALLSLELALGPQLLGVFFCRALTGLDVVGDFILLLVVMSAAADVMSLLPSARLRVISSLAVALQLVAYGLGNVYLALCVAHLPVRATCHPLPSSPLSAQLFHTVMDAHTWLCYLLMPTVLGALALLMPHGGAVWSTVLASVRGQRRRNSAVLPEDDGMLVQLLKLMLVDVGATAFGICVLLLTMWSRFVGVETAVACYSGTALRLALLPPAVCVSGAAGTLILRLNTTRPVCTPPAATKLV